MDRSTPMTTEQVWNDLHLFLLLLLLLLLMWRQ
jgi:hypothetical protein